MENTHYKITVLIPVFNAASFLETTMKSALQQTMPQKEYEIVLVDDGSVDGSDVICDRFASEYENVTVHHQVNSGVSAARNAGIQRARGKYILFLDSDDSIGGTTLKSLYDFFDEHDTEIDLVTYPLVYVYPDGRLEKHWRDTIMLETKVYNLSHSGFNYISQTTMNICVRTETCRRILFREGMKLREDQLFITHVLKEKNRIGYVRGAEYTYNKYDYISKKKNDHLLNCSEDLFAFWDGLKEIKSEYPLMREYCDNMIIYECNWRISTNQLLPYHEQGAKYAEALKKITSYLDEIRNRTIVNYPKMGLVRKSYLMWLKNKDRPWLRFEEKAIFLCDESGDIQKYPVFYISILHSEIEKEGIYINAFVKAAFLRFCEESPRLYATFDDSEKVEIPTFPSRKNHYETRMVIGNFVAFHFHLPLDTAIKRIRFSIGLNGYEYPVKLEFDSMQELEGSSRSYISGHGIKFYAERNELCIERGFFRPCSPAMPLNKRLRRMMMGWNMKRIWLYVDRAGVYDNAYIQYCHDFEKTDGIARYYIYDGELNEVASRFDQHQAKNLIKFGSLQHKILYGNAEYVLTSFVDTAYFRPFYDQVYRYYRSVAKPKIIYLQHGILHAKTPHYSKELLEVDRVVVSGNYERRIMQESGFRAKDLISSGMPRLDEINCECQAERKILFAPSWREYLTGGIRGLRWIPVTDEEFKNSSFFKGINSFLRDPRLSKMLHHYNYTLELKLHPIFQMYERLFEKLPDGIKLSSDQVELGRYAAFITDFSSFLYDFAYLRRPIYYFLPDGVEFRAGMNGYRELYIPFEEGLGLFTEDPQKMIDFLQKGIQRDFRIEEPFGTRMDEIYDSKEPIHRESLYKTLYEAEC